MPETAWPEGVIARYLTVGGAAVDITEHGPRDDEASASETSASCRGCDTQRWIEWRKHPHPGEWITTTQAAEDAEQSARSWAQAHAETCRAMPRPTA
jgi:hypothetical protein